MKLLSHGGWYGMFMSWYIVAWPGRANTACQTTPNITTSTHKQPFQIRRAFLELLNNWVRSLTVLSTSMFHIWEGFRVLQLYRRGWTRSSRESVTAAGDQVISGDGWWKDCAGTRKGLPGPQARDYPVSRRNQVMSGRCTNEMDAYRFPPLSLP